VVVTEERQPPAEEAGVALAGELVEHDPPGGVEAHVVAGLGSAVEERQPWQTARRSM
jgi:hypothetical protein